MVDRYLAQSVVRALAARGQSVASAESLTAGLFAATVAEVPGASAVLRGGLIVYATELKVTLATVSPQLIDQFGPVHPDVAAALADGARLRCGADWGVGLTGVAGPSPQAGVAPGTVYVGISDGSETSVITLQLEGDRAQVRAESVVRALDALCHRLGG